MIPAPGPNRDGAPGLEVSPDLLESSLMTGQTLRTFTNFSTDSGAGREIAELTRIKEDLAAKRSKVVNAPGSPPEATPRITISGESAMDAILRGMHQLDEEYNGREAAIVETIGNVEDLIQRGMGKLNRLANQVSSLWQPREQDHISRRSGKGVQAKPWMI